MLRDAAAIAQQRPSARRVGEGGAVENALAAQVGSAHHAMELATCVWRHRVALVEACGIDAEARLGVPDDEVGVEAGRDAALLLVEAGELRGRRAHPLRDAFGAVATSVRHRSHERKAQLERGDAAPGAQEVAALDELHRRRTGRVVARHEIYGALLERPPER